MTYLPRALKPCRVFNILLVSIVRRQLLHLFRFQPLHQLVGLCTSSLCPRHTQHQPDRASSCSTVLTLDVQSPARAINFVDAIYRSIHSHCTSDQHPVYLQQPWLHAAPQRRDPHSCAPLPAGISPVLHSAATQDSTTLE